MINRQWCIGYFGCCCYVPLFFWGDPACCPFFWPTHWKPFQNWILTGVAPSNLNANSHIHWLTISKELVSGTGKGLFLHLKVWSTVKIRGTRVPQKAIVPVGRPRPYSIIILSMRFIPKASLRASSQITASSYILEWHLWVNNSKLFALAPTWSLACKQTDCITAGMLKLLDLKLVLTSQ